MLKTYEWGDPAISVRRYQRLAAHFRHKRDAEHLRIMDRLGALRALADAGGPHTARIALATMAQVARVMDRYEAEAAWWAGAAWRVAQLHAHDTPGRTQPWRPPLVHNPLQEDA